MSRIRKSLLFLQKVAQLLGTARVTQLSERLCFDLSNALTGDAELLAYLFQGAASPVFEAEA